MKRIFTYLAILIGTVLAGQAQDGSQSSAVMRRDGGAGRGRQADERTTPGVTERMQSFMQTREPGDAELQWMRVIYRELDLTRPQNAPLYYPDEPLDGQESLFRIIMRLMANDQLAAYEYLDGREVFTDKYRVKVKDVLDRFHIMHTDAKGSTERHPKFEIDDSDVPANEVLTYYIIERWEFDRLSNRMRTRIEAICPVLHRSGDFGGEPVRYPMFWVKMDDLKPYLSTQNIFTDDDNNLATSTYADFFQLGLYEGDIYKTRNLQNKSLMQIHQDPEALKNAQDSIQRRLTTFEDKLWVPSLDELAARRIAREEAEARAAAAADGDSLVVTEDKPEVKKPTTRAPRSKRGNQSGKKPAGVKKPKAPKSSGSSGASKSVRNRRKR